MIRLAAGGLLLSLLLLGVPSHVLAQAPSLNWGSEVNPSRCPTDQGYRYLEINVTRKVENDPTLGKAGNQWAMLDYIQHIQVWKVGSEPVLGGAEKFCALVRYQGSFTTLAAPRKAASVLSLSPSDQRNETLSGASSWSFGAPPSVARTASVTTGSGS